MRNKFLMLFLILLSSLTFAKDESHGGGGYKGPSRFKELTTIKDILNLGRKADDRYVRLVGYITEHIKEDKYTFKDDTGTIQIEIEHEIWKGLSVDETEQVMIEGEVDKDPFKIEIEVDRISLKD